MTTDDRLLTSNHDAVEAPIPDERDASSDDSGAGPEPGPAAEPAADAAPDAAEVEPEAPADPAVEPGAPAAPEPEPEVAEPGSEAEPAAEAAAEPEVAEHAGPAVQTVAELLAATMRSAGVKYAFTVPGESFLPLLTALDRVGIHVVATRHESGAAFMAEAYGQLTGRPAACIGTRAVGGSNLAIGIHTARQNSTPMFAVAGQVVRAFRGREAFQEADLATSIGGLAKWAGELIDPTAAPEMFANAAHAAIAGRPGPVFLSIPEDVFEETVETMAVPPGLRGPLERPDQGSVRSILRLLAAAERPVILAGGGVLRARCSNDLVRLAEMLRVPVISAWRRGDVFPNRHPLYLGMTGYGAPATVRRRLEEADAMLVIGSRLSEVTTFGYTVPSGHVRWAHVDLEPRSPGHGERPPDIAVAADARAFLRAAVSQLSGGVLDAAVADARSARTAEDRAAWEAATTVDEGAWDGPGVHPGRVITILRSVLPDEAIVTTDAGNFGMWAARGFRFVQPGTFLGPTSGAMGYGLPAAIAAGLIHRDRPVVALTGDGGLTMTIGELETALRERLRTVVLVFDNQRYGTIRMHQERLGPGNAIATDLGPIDFVALARGFGARGIRVEATEEFEPALRSALASTTPTVIHLVLDRAWVSVDERPG
jgi:acetolactate synthase-1/2/3 large subunit